MANRPRRLLAILHADLAGYVRLMEGSEDQTVDRLQMVRAEIWRPAIEAGGGSVVNIEGDSVLAEFGSATAAVAAAIDIQERLALFNALLEEDQRLMYRIGLHLGVVIVDERTRSIFGDGVNLAARIQAMAEPGGIAVSHALREAAELRAGHAFIDGGEHWAKNVSRPLRIYHVRPRSDTPAHAAAIVPPPTRRPSAALIRASRLGSNARLAMRRPALWSVVAGAALLLAGVGYLAHQATAPATVATVALSLSAEQLEQALAERRKADALALEKRQLEVEARHKAAVGAEAKRQAEAELERTRQARQKAEDDLAKLKADIASRRGAETSDREQSEAARQRAAEEAAQRRAEDEAAGLRRAEEDAKKKAGVDAAAKRQADEALARAESARRHAEQEAQRKAEAEQSALRRASEDSASAALARQKQESEIAEKGLRLDQPARARLQVVLTSLGFDTSGSDGIFGPRTRDMIEAWQKARGLATTGYLTAPQRQALMKEGTAALARYDEGRNVEEEARTRAAVPVSLNSPPTAPLVPASSAGGSPAVLDSGSYKGVAFAGNSIPFRLNVSLQMANGRGVGTLASPACQQSRFAVAVSSIGAITGEVYFNCVVTVGAATIAAGDFKITGAYHGKEIWLDFHSARHSFGARLAAQASPVVAAVPVVAATPAAATPSAASSDGLWRGAYTCGAGSNLSPPFTIPLELRVSNGSATWKGTRSWAVTVGGTLEIRLVVSGSSVSVTRTYGMGLAARGTLSGHYDGVGISAAGRELGGGIRECKVTLTRS